MPRRTAVSVRKRQYQRKKVQKRRQRRRSDRRQHKVDEMCPIDAACQEDIQYTAALESSRTSAGSPGPKERKMAPPMQHLAKTAHCQDDRDVDKYVSDSDLLVGQSRTDLHRRSRVTVEELQEEKDILEEKLSCVRTEAKKKIARMKVQYRNMYSGNTRASKLLLLSLINK